MKEKLTYERLHEILDYNPDTGVLVWKISTNRRIKIGTEAGCVDNVKGYVRVCVDGHLYLAHRIIWFWVNGYMPENDIDHKDRIPWHNWWDNLREASKSCNMRNRKKHSNNKSGVTGVRLCSANGKWISRIYVFKKAVHLGCFSSFNDAVMARWKAEIKYNFPTCNTTSSAYQYIQGLK